ncbi:MAG: 6-phosphogluconolactonase [Spirochaetes bacterium]|nr:6-phosphogluconolactonase [Spirochaetota bacterium]
MIVARFPSRSSWIAAAVDDFVEAIRGFEPSSSPTGRFEICAAGGTTPGGVYQAIAALPLNVPVRLRPGDERWLPAGSPDRNGVMLRRAFSGHAWEIEPEFGEWPSFVPGSSPERAASEYGERLLGEFLGFPRFDYCWLGLGADGHTASLFPGLDAGEGRVAVAGASPLAPCGRLSFSAPVFRAARRVVFLVAGPAKLDALDRLESGDPSIPATRAAPADTLVLYSP